MKYKTEISLTLISIILLVACRKQAPETSQAATLTIVNTILQGDRVRLNTYVQPINNNSFANVGLMPGEANLYIYPTNDSVHPYYTNPKLVVGSGEIFTLFLSGSTSALDGTLIKEDLPRHTDSTMGVRFINLSLGSMAVNVTLSTTPSVVEFSDIAYKQLTEFRSYPVKSVNNSYTFQVRIANSGALISSLTLSGTNFTTGLPRFKNITIVLRGLVDGSPAAGITRVNHY